MIAERSRATSILCRCQCVESAYGHEGAPVESNNVVAKLAGSDPKRTGDAVLYTAHYDHLGIRADEPGDNIYNGADDNATGCGIL